jgi:hypothetical protein
MILFLLRKCSRKQYEGIREILNNNKFVLLTINSLEGVFTEINNKLDNNELFNLYRKYRKKYFKLKNIHR